MVEEAVVEHRLTAQTQSSRFLGAGDYMDQPGQDESIESL
jgi:hypothetical protein